MNCSGSPTADSRRCVALRAAPAGADSIYIATKPVNSQVVKLGLNSVTEKNISKISEVEVADGKDLSGSRGFKPSP
jgi:hypothetical protein